MSGDFLLGAGLVLGALAVAGALFLRLRQSVIPAFILLGVLVRPDRFDEHMVEALATIGVVLLLFYMGLEFSLRALLENRRQILRTGAIDLVALPVGILAGLLLGHGISGALLFGGAFYVTSSAIVAKSIIELRRAADPETEVGLGILVFEDLAIALYLAVLSGAVLVAEPSLSAAGGGILKAILFFGLGLLIAVRARPLLNRLLDVGSDDLFVLLAGALVLLLSWLALRAGLSEAIGAFLAGLVVAETRHRERADRLFAPLQGLFAAVFFFAFGLSIDPRTFGQVWLPALLLALLAAAVKVGVGWFAGRRSGLGPRASLSLGLILVPRGEFSIIIAGLALAAGMAEMASLLAMFVLILSLLGTATLQYAPQISRWAFPRKPVRSLEAEGFRPDLAAFPEPDRRAS